MAPNPWQAGLQGFGGGNPGRWDPEEGSGPRLAATIAAHLSPDRSIFSRVLQDLQSRKSDPVADLCPYLVFVTSRLSPVLCRAEPIQVSRPPMFLPGGPHSRLLLGTGTDPA